MALSNNWKKWSVAVTPREWGEDEAGQLHGGLMGSPHQPGWPSAEKPLQVFSRGEQSGQMWAVGNTIGCRGEMGQDREVQSGREQQVQRP